MNSLIEPPSLPRRYTLAEYFELEARSEVRHEYFGGKLFPLTGISKAHNALALNLARALSAMLQGASCEVFAGAIQVVVQEDFHYVYPDLVLSCDPDDHRNDYQVRKPLLVAEVQSATTAEYDRTSKLHRYFKLPSLRYCILIDENRQCVQWFRRNEVDEWAIAVLLDPSELLEIVPLQLRLTLAELYADTDIVARRLAPSQNHAL